MTLFGNPPAEAYRTVPWPSRPRPKDVPRTPSGPPAPSRSAGRGRSVACGDWTGRTAIPVTGVTETGARWTGPRVDRRGFAMGRRHDEGPDRGEQERPEEELVPLRRRQTEPGLHHQRRQCGRRQAEPQAMNQPEPGQLIARSIAIGGTAGLLPRARRDAGPHSGPAAHGSRLAPRSKAGTGPAGARSAGTPTRRTRAAERLPQHRAERPLLRRRRLIGEGPPTWQGPGTSWPFSAITFIRLITEVYARGGPPGR